MEVSRIGAVPSILKVASELTGMRVTLVARVTGDSWTVCAAHDKLGLGLGPGVPLEVTTTLCREVCDANRTIVVENASADPARSFHRTAEPYRIESYVAIPIVRPGGQGFGTLCAVDHHPVSLEPKVVDALKLFAAMISGQLGSEESTSDALRSLSDERRQGQLREEFIAVLGHDLRTPLGSIHNSAELVLELGGLTPVQKMALDGMVSSAKQMAGLVSDVLDLARGRLGAGMVVERSHYDDVTLHVRRVVSELRSVFPKRDIRLEARAPNPATIDAVRFHQMMTNLVGNAIQHSPDGTQVRISMGTTQELLRISVHNAGSIPAELRENLFRPFQRSLKKEGRKRDGLGLGLYIASEIARAHSGSLQAESDEQGTKLTVLLPTS